MYCQNCGKELPPDARSCGGCGAVVPTGHRPKPTPTVHQLVTETRRVARDLMSATAQLSREAAHQAEAAGRDPKGTAKRAAHRVAKELDDAAKEIERILKEL
jgi:zinc-ribbon domain